MTQEKNTLMKLPKQRFNVQLRGTHGKWYVEVRYQKEQTFGVEDSYLQ